MDPCCSECQRVVLVINGPLGVGKSSTSEALMHAVGHKVPGAGKQEHGSDTSGKEEETGGGYASTPPTTPVCGKCVFLEGDALLVASDITFRHARFHQEWVASVCALLRHHAQRGYRNVIIDYVFESRADLQALVASIVTTITQLPCSCTCHARATATTAAPSPPFRAAHPAVMCFRLAASAEALVARVVSRGRSDIAWERKRCVELCDVLESAGKLGKLGELVDTETCDACTHSRPGSDGAKTVCPHLSSAAAVATAVLQRARCHLGTVSDKAAHFARLDFASRYVPWVWNGLKTCTTRLARHKSCMVESLQLGDMVLATANDRGHKFALLCVTDLLRTTMGELTDDIAKRDGFASVDELQQALRHHYSGISEDSRVVVVSFVVVHWFFVCTV